MSDNNRLILEHKSLILPLSVAAAAGLLAVQFALRRSAKKSDNACKEIPTAPGSLPYVGESIIYI